MLETRVRTSCLETAICVTSHENDHLGRLADIDESTAAWHPALTEIGDVDVAFDIHLSHHAVIMTSVVYCDKRYLSHTQEGDIDATAVVEI